MSILSPKPLPLPVSPAAAINSRPDYPAPKKGKIRPQFVGGMACSDTSRALVSSLRPADNFSPDRRPHPSPFSRIPAFFFSPATQLDDGQHQSAPCGAGSRHQQTFTARELTMREVKKAVQKLKSKETHDFERFFPDEPISAWAMAMSLDVRPDKLLNIPHSQMVTLIYEFKKKNSFLVQVIEGLAEIGRKIVAESLQQETLLPRRQRKEVMA